MTLITNGNIWRSCSDFEVAGVVKLDIKQVWTPQTVSGHITLFGVAHSKLLAMTKYFSFMIYGKM